MTPASRLAALAVALLFLLPPASAGAGELGQNTPEAAEAATHPSSAAGSQSTSVKQKTLYFHNDTQSIGGTNRTQTANSTLGVNKSVVCFGAAPCGGSQMTLTFYQFPGMAMNATLNGSVAVVIWMRSTEGNNMFVDLTLTVRSISPAGGLATHVVSPQASYDPVTSHFSEYRVATGPARFTVPEGHHLVFELLLKGDNSRQVFIAWGDDLYRSRAVVPMETHMRIAAAATLDANRTAQSSFDPQAADKTIIFNATVEDPLGGYDVKWANLSLEGPPGKLLDRAPMAKAGGAPGGRFAWFEHATNYTGWPVGKYNFTIDAVDNTGFHYRFPSNIGDLTYGGHLESMRSSFYIGSAPVPLWVRADDSLGAPLAQATVAIRSIGPYFIDVNSTGAGGLATLVSPIGSWRFLVLWQAVEVYNESRTVTGPNNATNPLVLRARVFTGAIQVLDVGRAPLPGALVHLVHPNSTALPTMVTNATGEVPFVRMAGGNYSLAVDYRGVDVFIGTLAIVGNRTYAVVADVYYLTLVVSDLAGRRLAGALVMARDNVTDIVTDSRITNQTGVALARLPRNVYDMEVFWLETLVNATRGYQLGGNATLAITAVVFTLRLRLVDSRSLAVEGAQVDVALKTGRVVLTGVTAADGRTSMQAPGGTFRLVARWSGAVVMDDPDFLVSGTAEREIKVWVFYLTARLADSRGVPVAFASISTHRGGVPVGSAVTGPDGKADLRLATGDSQVTANWHGVEVHNSTVTVAADDARDLPARVHYLKVMPSDSRGAPVKGATAEAWVGAALVSSNLTDAAGAAELRSPATSIVVKLRWRGVEIASVPKTVDRDEDLPVQAKVFYLNVKVVDREGKAVGDAEVSARRSLILESNFTGSDGASIFRLPNGSYDIEVRYRSAHYLTPVDSSASMKGVAVSADAEVTVKLEDYPPSVFATGAFAIGLLFALLILLAALLVYLIAKKRRRDREAALGGAEKVEAGEPLAPGPEVAEPDPKARESEPIEASEEAPEPPRDMETGPRKRAVPPPFAALPPSEIEQAEGAREEDPWPEERQPSRLDHAEDLIRPPGEAAEAVKPEELVDKVLGGEQAKADEGAPAATQEAMPGDGDDSPPSAALSMSEAQSEGKCSMCKGKIKAGALESVCGCGARYHVACGKRAAACASCGKSLAKR
jgi:hypothetical protein